MADLFDSAQSRRLFPVIAIGGSAGSIAGPLVASVLSVEQILFASMAMLVLAILCTLGLSRWSRVHPNPERRALADLAIGGAWWTGLRQITTSPFLRKMVVLTLISEAVGTMAYALVADYAGATFADRKSRTQFYAHMDLATNLLAIVLQASVARLILRRLGNAAALVTSSSVNFLVLLVVAVVGGPAVVAMLLITRACAYGLFKPAADALYSRMEREARYKGKNAIDTVVWRAGDVIVSGAMSLLAPLSIGIAGYALASAACSAVSGWLGWRLPKSPDLAPEELRG
jgi:AAA family ATP:ADP antiporter